MVVVVGVVVVGVVVIVVVVGDCVLCVVRLYVGCWLLALRCWYLVVGC